MSSELQSTNGSNTLPKRKRTRSMSPHQLANGSGPDPAKRARLKRRDSKERRALIQKLQAHQSSTRKDTHDRQTLRSNSVDDANHVSKKIRSINALPESINLVKLGDPGPSTMHSKGKGAARLEDKEDAKEVQRLRKELLVKDEILNKQQTTLQSLQGILSCQICLELMWRPYSLTPCGHVCCYTCLKAWFTAPPNGGDDNQPLFIPAQRPKSCPCCRTDIRTRPVAMYLVKSAVNSIVTVLDPDSFARPPTDEVGDNVADPWKDVFPPIVNQNRPASVGGINNDAHVIYDDEDGGVPRCSVCLFEVFDAVCAGCGRHFPDLEGYGSYYDDAESVSSEGLVHAGRLLPEPAAHHPMDNDDFIVDDDELPDYPARFQGIITRFLHGSRHSPHSDEDDESDVLSRSSQSNRYYVDNEDEDEDYHGHDREDYENYDGSDRDEEDAVDDHFSRAANPSTSDTDSDNDEYGPEEYHDALEGPPIGPNGRNHRSAIYVPSDDGEEDGSLARPFRGTWPSRPGRRVVYRIVSSEEEEETNHRVVRRIVSSDEDEEPIRIVDEDLDINEHPIHLDSSRASPSLDLAGQVALDEHDVYGPDDFISASSYSGGGRLQRDSYASDDDLGDDMSDRLSAMPNGSGSENDHHSAQYLSDSDVSHEDVGDMDAFSDGEPAYSGYQ